MKRVARRSRVKWLILCPPYGLFLMWRGEFRWRKPQKAIITAFIAAIAVTIVAWPSPDRANGTKVVLVGAKPEAEVFGPELPKEYDASDYYVESSDNSIVPETTAEDTTIYVYASNTEGSTYYHTSTCKYAYASSKRMTLYEAYMLGYTTPCNLCSPPVYTPDGN